MIEPNQGPVKVYAESAESRVLQGQFYLTFQSGEEVQGFVLSIQLAKALGKIIAQQVERMEKETGQNFDGASTKETIPSPWSSNPEDEKPQ